MRFNNTIVRQQALRALGEKRYKKAINQCLRVVNHLTRKTWYHKGTVVAGEHGGGGMVDTMLAMIVTCNDIDQGLQEYLRYVDGEYNHKKHHVEALMVHDDFNSTDGPLWSTMGEWANPLVADYHKERSDASDQPDERLIEVKNILGL